MKLKPIKTPETPEERFFNLICNYVDIYQNQQKDAYMIIKYKKNKELCFLSDHSMIENRIREICFNELDKIVKKTCLDSIYKTIQMQANRTTDVVPTVRRCYFDGNQRHIRFHDLRHINATLMLQYGVPAKIASERLGHSTIQTTMNIYSHVTVEMQKDTVNIFDNNIFSKVAEG